jgi:hypothetical protein
MKERYYSISARILYARLHDSTLKLPDKVISFYEHSMKAFQTLNYNPDAEQRKRKQIDAAFRRSNDSLLQERTIMKELKVLEVTIRKTTAKGSKFLSNILDAPGSSSPGAGPFEIDQKPFQGKQKQVKQQLPDSSIVTDASSGGEIYPVVAADIKKPKGRPRKNAAMEAPLSPPEGLGYVSAKPFVDPFASAVALRSAQISAPLHALGPNWETMRKAKEMIQGLRVSERPIASVRVLPVYHSLLRETAELLEIAKEVDEAEKRAKMLPHHN